MCTAEKFAAPGNECGQGLAGAVRETAGHAARRRRSAHLVPPGPHARPNARPFASLPLRALCAPPPPTLYAMENSFVRKGKEGHDGDW